MSFSNNFLSNIFTNELCDVIKSATSDLIPSLDNVYNLGSSARRWAKIFVENVNFGNEDLNDYREQTLNLTYSGAVSFASTAKITKIGRQITLELAPIGAILTTAGASLVSNNFLDVSLRPNEQKIFYGVGAVGATSQMLFIIYLGTSGGVIIQPMTVSANNVIPNNFPSATTINMINTTQITYSK
jgi:hypothetical protein